MRVERGYDYEDTCTVSRETMPNYDEKIKSFYEEHIHSDEVRPRLSLHATPPTHPPLPPTHSTLTFRKSATAWTARGTLTCATPRTSGFGSRWRKTT